MKTVYKIYIGSESWFMEYDNKEDAIEEAKFLAETMHGVQVRKVTSTEEVVHEIR